jgi:hypothetical protein
MLQRDYPRVPFPRSMEAFEKVGSLGQELVQLHLLRDERLLRPALTIQGASGRPLARSRSVLCRYHASAGRIELDEHSFCFEGVAPEVWLYRIGGHQVLAPGARGRVLRHRDLSLFLWAAEALRLTLGLEAPLAEAYRGVENDRATFEG